MKLVKVDRNQIPGTYQMTKLLQLLNEFVESGLACARVADHTYSSAYSGVAALNASAKRFGLSGGGKSACKMRRNIPYKKGGRK